MASTESTICDADSTAVLQSDSSFNNWKTSTDTALNLLTPSVNPTAADIRAMSTKQLEILNVIKCIQSKTATVSQSPTSIQAKLTNIANLREQIQATKKDVEVAHDRVKYLRHPERNTSYYESWFPLQRPLKEGSIPILVFLSMFFFAVALLTLLSAAGIYLEFTVPMSWLVAFGPNTTTSGLYKVGFYVLLVVLAVMVALTIYGFLRK